MWNVHWSTFSSKALSICLIFSVFLWSVISCHCMERFGEHLPKIIPAPISLDKLITSADGSSWSTLFINCYLDYSVALPIDSTIGWKWLYFILLVDDKFHWSCYSVNGIGVLCRKYVYCILSFCSYGQSLQLWSYGPILQLWSIIATSN